MIELEKNEFQKKMTAAVRHEIKNRIRSMTSPIRQAKRILADDKADYDSIKDEISKDIDQTIKKAKDTVDLIDEGLDYLREIKLDEEGKVDILIKEAMGSFAGEFSENSIKVYIEIDEDLPPILLNSNKLKDAIYNLIKNAYEAIIQTSQNEKKEDSQPVSR